MAEPNLQEIHDLLIEIALKAGTMITSAHPSQGGTDTKINSTDLVTATDKEVETMVSTTLKERFPTYEFLGEETYTPGTPLTAAPTFICDPIDGTTNFVHGNPNVCISLGFTTNLSPLVGVVYNPFLRQLYHGIKGHGAYLTSIDCPTPHVTSTTPTPPPGTPPLHLGPSRKLPLRNPAEPLTGLSAALMAHEWGNEREGANWIAKTTTFMNLAGALSSTPSSASSPQKGGMLHGLRSTGSSALNICAVATGGVDAYWEGGCWAWDVAAAWCVLVEAGGMMVGANPGGWEARVDGRVYLAVRGVGRVGGAGGGVGGGAGEGKGGGGKGVDVGEGAREMQRRFVEEVWGCVRGELVYEV
ncbi:hypothetical protein MMC30_008053 [Trapelia coarctata]|nr:hypothetical protein [Trapelia coarctata]